ncbi:hypothetical protein Zmor_005423 [Zophobas morio]|uniref:Uncharacterized protein n=1 Tax=Zophobas morio TaxID=2755281 RepID=A0AA38MM85_9CUCU|nr:hypothetical protein Zmor_005423 [Zophobas morio]
MDIKRQSEGHVLKKSKILEKGQVQQFIIETPNDVFLMAKVALIFGIAGALRKHELLELQTNNVEDLKSKFLVTIPGSRTKTKEKRVFTIDQLLWTKIPDGVFQVAFADDLALVINVKNLDALKDKAVEAIKMMRSKLADIDLTLNVELKPSYYPKEENFQISKCHRAHLPSSRDFPVSRSPPKSPGGDRPEGNAAQEKRPYRTSYSFFFRELAPERPPLLTEGATPGDTSRPKTWHPGSLPPQVIGEISDRPSVTPKLRRTTNFDNSSPLENLLHYLSKDVPPNGINMIAERKSFIENYSDAKNNIWTKAKDFLTNGDDIN